MKTHRLRSGKPRENDQHINFIFPIPVLIAAPLAADPFSAPLSLGPLVVEAGFEIGHDFFCAHGNVLFARISVGHDTTP